MSKKYWEERFTQEEARRNKEVIKQIKIIDEQYNKALHEIDKKIDYWYNKMASNNEISFQGAKQLLSKNELKEFKWSVEEYIQKGVENDLNKGLWTKQLKNASAKVHISRLEAMKIQIQHDIENMYQGFDNQIKKHLERIYADTYNRTIFDIGQGQGFVKSSFNRLDKRKLNEVIHKPWTQDGIEFSNRIWKDKTDLVNKLHTGITQNIIRGGDTQKLIEEVQEFLHDKIQNKKYVASRLVNTETAAYASKAQRQAFKELGVDKYEIVATLDTHTSNICQSMDGKVFDMKDYEVGVTAPPFHANCRTVTVPWFPDEVDKGERAARDLDGELIYVPQNMKYKEWKEKYFTLTLEEERTIMKYKSPGGEIYILNDKLRNGVELTEEEKEWVKNLDSVLKKMPYYKGQVTRTINLAKPKDLEKLMWECVPNKKTFTFPAYTSTSKGELYNEDMNVRYIINSKKARDISSFGLQEDEVIYERNCKFKVYDVEYKENILIIFLEELNE